MGVTVQRQLRDIGVVKFSPGIRREAKVIVLMKSRTKLSGQSPGGAQVIVPQVALIYSLGAPSPAPKGIG